MIYNPQRVMRQFNYDQGVVIMTGELVTSSTLVAKARFISQENDQILAGWRNCFGLGGPCRNKVSKGTLFWHKLLGLMNAFVNNDNEVNRWMPV